MPPNIILTMCDDLGYGDTGFAGHPVLRTPHLDAMAAAGARFTRFCAGGPVCSPTRGTCLTGRHYFRYGVTHANQGCLPRQEWSLGRLLKDRGYATGHFGKWHLGTLTTTEPESNRGGPDHPEHYSPPWEHGFDTCFSTEARVPTWDPMVTPEGEPSCRSAPGEPFNTYYRDATGRRVTDDLAGDDARVIMDRVLPFIRDAVQQGKPFFAVVWFHTPHTPVVAGPDYRAMYAAYSEGEQHYYGCVTAMDEQVGRLNVELARLGVAEHTCHWFCSDNGPEGRDGLTDRNRGSTGGLRGRKRSLFNGGVMVPALVQWPAAVQPGAVVTAPCSTLDYLPTILAGVNTPLPTGRVLDGVNLLPLLRGETTERGRPIPYRFLDGREGMFGSPTFALLGDRFKYFTNFTEDRSEDLLFDVETDPYEQYNVIGAHPDRANEARKRLQEFLDSCRESHHGAEYDEPYEPINAFQDVTGGWA